MLERVVSSRLKDHMRNNNSEEMMQSAYRSCHSTETAIVKIKDDLLKAVDNKQVVIMTLLDLSAAFDTIDHSTLIQRLRHRIGLTGTALEWFSSYLKDRFQACSIDGVKSAFVKLLFGVPQGSVLGPLLFSRYTLPVAKIAKRHGVNFHFYADDTQLYVSFDVGSNHTPSMQSLERCIIY